MEPKKYEYIDSLRGIAILMVIFGHAGCLDQAVFNYFPRVVVDFLQTIGGLGVRMFFIVSAFTLMMSYQNRKDEKRSTLNFFVRRYFRIAPIYYIAILFFSFAAIGYTLSGANWEELPKRSMITSFLFVSGFFPSTLNNYVLGGWSIAIEFMFYFALPFVALRVKNVNTAFIFTLSTLLLSSLLGYVLKGTIVDKNGFLFYYIVNHLPVFGLGMLAYWIVSEKSYKISSFSWLLLSITILTYCYVDILFCFVHCIAFFVLLLVLSKKPYKLFSNAILANIGKVSFSLYLTHFMVLILAGKNGLFSFLPKITGTLSSIAYILLAFIAITGVSYLLSLLTYKFVEVPGQNLGKKIINKLNN